MHSVFVAEGNLKLLIFNQQNLISNTNSQILVHKSFLTPSNNIDTIVFG